jgi:High potential iron-sulfur protein
LSPRRAALKSLLAVVALIGTGRAIAAKLAKADVKYQDTPNSGKDCADCIHFIPDPHRKGRGSCQVVAGPVSAHGYCLAFTPKPKTGSST